MAAAGSSRLPWNLASMLAVGSCLVAVGCGPETSVHPIRIDDCPPSIARATGDHCPSVTAVSALTGLLKPVSVLRDRYGWLHIYANTVPDAFRAQGWMAASDRMPQLELLRRVAEGRTAELWGALDPSTIDDDIVYRTLGFGRLANEQYAALDPGGPERQILDAFADGVSQWIVAAQSGKVLLPKAATGLAASDLRPWTGADSLAIERLQAWVRTETLGSDLDLQQIVDGFRSVFRPDASSPELRARSGMVRDMLRFAPLDPTTVLTGFPGLGAPPSASSAPPGPPAPLTRTAPSASFRRALTGALSLLGLQGGGIASDAWALSGVRTATTHAMLANDPGGALSSPSALLPVQLIVEDTTSPSDDLDVLGMSLPGVPGVVLGFNRDLAWGRTAARFDVTDVYQESLTSDAKAVRFRGRDVALEKIDEPIAIRGAAPYDYTVYVVPHHGPILPVIGENHRAEPLDPKAGALSMRWTGLEPNADFGALVGLWRARNVDQARAALKGSASSDSWVLADTHGHIALTEPVRVPYRAPGALDWDPDNDTGHLPCLVLPGDGSAEWAGDVDTRLLPAVEDPPSGFVVAANNDPIGTTLDNDPVGQHWTNGDTAYLSCFYDLGLRAARIQNRIENAGLGKITLDQMAQIQGDARSSLGALFTPRLLTVLKLAQDERTVAGSFAELSKIVNTPRYQSADIPDIFRTLDDWANKDDYQAASGLNPDDDQPVSDADQLNAAKATLIFNAWLTRVMGRVFSDEFDQVHARDPDFDPNSRLLNQLSLRAFARLWSSDPSSLATYDSARGDSVLWDDLGTQVFETRSQQIVLAMLDAVDDLNRAFGSDRSGWLWGKAHTVTFESPVANWSFDVPQKTDSRFPHGYPRHGDAEAVDAGNYPTMRGPSDALDFTFRVGPAERFLVDLDPDGARAFDALPGGAVGDPARRHFTDESDLWRRNQNHPIPFSAGDVAAASASAEHGEHLVLLP